MKVVTALGDTVNLTETVGETRLSRIVPPCLDYTGFGLPEKALYTGVMNKQVDWQREIERGGEGERCVSCVFYRLGLGRRPISGNSFRYTIKISRLVAAVVVCPHLRQLNKGVEMKTS